MKIASARGIWSGRTPRAFAVANPTAGVATTRRRSSGHAQRNASGSAPFTSSTEFNPPKSAGAALSACPSTSVAAPSRTESATGPVTRSNTRRPATVAAALLPNPAAIGTSLVTSTKTVGADLPVRAGDYVECPLQSVRAVDGRSALRHHQLRPAVVANVGDSGAKVELNRHTEGIEPTAQVGDRAGYPHLASEGCAAGLK